jgi:hypothetical protein
MADPPSVNYDNPVSEVSDLNTDELAEEIVTEIKRPRQGDFRERGPDGWMDPHALPGFGDPYDDCTEPIPHFCVSCGDTFSKGRRCKRSVCPECAPLWVVDRAESDLAHLRAVAKVMGAKMGKSVKMHHVIFSPPQANDETDHGWYLAADDPLQRTREVVSNILSVMNAEGIVYYHGWSGEQGDDIGEWKQRLFSGRDWEDVRGELKPRPHFHAVVASPFIAGGEITKRVTEETGWVIERIADEDGKSLETLTDAARAITYCLSHSSIRLEYCANGDNKVAKQAYGRIWHSDRLTVYDNIKRQAEREVRSVAPRTLGISPSRMRCETDVPVNAWRDDTVEVGDAYNDDVSDSDSDHAEDDSCESEDTESEDSEPDDCESDECESEDRDDGSPTEVQTVTCKGVIRPLADAGHYLDDEDWVQTTLHSDELRREYEDFQAEAQLDNPPPIVDAFT